MRAEPWPITCRARSRSRVPPASRRPKVRWWTVVASRLISVHRLGLMACLAGGVEGAGDLRFVEAGLAGGGGQGAQVGGGVGVQGAVGGPVQAGVAVAFGLAGDPAGQLAERTVRSLGRCWALLVPLGFQESGDRGPVQAAVAVEFLDEPVGLAVDLGGRGEDVAALGAEVQVVAGQAAVVLVGAGEVGVHPAGRGPHVGGRAVDQARALERGEGGVAVSGFAVLVDVQDVGAGGAGGDGQVPAEAAAEPFGDLLLIGGGVQVAVLGGGDLLAGQAGESPISSTLLRFRRPRPPRPRKPNATIAQVDGSGMGDEPAGPNTAEPRATKRSSDVALMTSFRRTPPPQVQMSARGEEQAAPSSVSASKPGPFRPPNVSASRRASGRSIARAFLSQCPPRSARVEEARAGLSALGPAGHRPNRTVQRRNPPSRSYAHARADAPNDCLCGL